MNTHALEQYPPYIVKKLKKVFEEQSLEHLCSYVEVGDTPYIISLSPHVFKRVREQLDIHADQQATTLAILENGDVVVGIENIANVQISLNTKLNRTTRERERSA